MHAATGFSKLAFEVTISDKVGSILPGSGWVGCSNTDTLQTLRLASFRAAVAFGSLTWHGSQPCEDPSTQRNYWPLA